MIRYIHLGYQKSGSTFLQSMFFSAHPEIADILWPNKDREVRTLLQAEILRRSVLNYDAAEIKRRVESCLAAAENRRDGIKVVGLSSEELTGFPYVDLTIIAERLREIFGDAQVIVVVRNQIDLITSFYAECLKGGFFGNLDSFLEYHYWNRVNGLLPSLEYSKIIDAYVGLFGKENVHVLLFEDLRRDPQAFCDDLGYRLGLAHLRVDARAQNPSFKPLTQTVLRQLNRLFPYDLGMPRYSPDLMAGRLWSEIAGIQTPNTAMRSLRRRDRLIAFARRLNRIIPASLGAVGRQAVSETWRERLEDLYRAENRNLAASFSLDLEGCGYPL
jgi:hypothetical protein